MCRETNPIGEDILSKHIETQYIVPAKEIHKFLYMMRRYDGEPVGNCKRDYRGYVFFVRFEVEKSIAFETEWKEHLRPKTFWEKLKLAFS